MITGGAVGPCGPRQPSSPDDARQAHFARLPKIELHLHLEGAIPLASLWQLVRKYGGESEVPTLAALASRFQYRDFPHFIDTWVWKNQFLREYEDFTFIASEVARDLASQNVLYAEVFYSPGDYRRVGLDDLRIAEAVRTGLRGVSEISVSLITDLIRDHGPERAEATLDVIREICGDLGIIGVGIGGSEHLFPPEPFARVYERARAFGLRTTAHAGEVCGPESVWGAIRALRVDRVGHATRAMEDPALLDYLAEHQIPVELCVISNVRTGAVKSVAEHPAREYFERGIPLSVNTDDPKLFNTSLADEFLALHNELGFSVPEIHSLIEQAVRSSWLPDAEKADLLSRIRTQVEAIPTAPEMNSP
jgi:adenosine deaminase